VKKQNFKLYVISRNDVSKTQCSFLGPCITASATGSVLIKLVRVKLTPRAKERVVATRIDLITNLHNTKAI
jgi:hypothetical protein